MGTLTDSAGQTTYLDANILIYFLEEHSHYSSHLLELVQAIDDGKIKAVTSELSLAECLVKPFHDKNLSRQKTYQSFLVSGPNLQTVPISRSILVMAAQLRASHKPRLPDAIHLATALELACETFITNGQLVKPIPGITILQLADLIP